MTWSERITPEDVPPEYLAQHRARYLFTTQSVKGLRVLDLACGVGYGSRLLAESGAAQVVGVDASAEALREGTKSNRATNIHLIQGDGLRLPFRDASFDVCVSFETIEHLSSPTGFLGELGRVMKPWSPLFLSTPNRAVTNPGVPRDVKPANPFHVMEFTLSELRRLLRGRFRVKEVYGQEFFPVWTILRSRSWPGVLARHPAFPLVLLPRLGEYFRAYSSKALEELARPADTFTISPLGGRATLSHEPAVLLLVCERVS